MKACDTVFLAIYGKSMNFLFPEFDDWKHIKLPGFCNDIGLVSDLNVTILQCFCNDIKPAVDFIVTKWHESQESINYWNWEDFLSFTRPSETRTTAWPKLVSMQLRWFRIHQLRPNRHSKTEWMISISWLDDCNVGKLNSENATAKTPNQPEFAG